MFHEGVKGSHFFAKIKNLIDVIILKRLKKKKIIRIQDDNQAKPTQIEVIFTILVNSVFCGVLIINILPCGLQQIFAFGLRESNKDFYHKLAFTSPDPKNVGLEHLSLSL